MQQQHTTFSQVAQPMRDVRDPPVQTEASIRAAYEANCEARAAVGRPQLPVPSALQGYALPQPLISDPVSCYAPGHPTLEQDRMLNAQNALSALIQQYGSPQVSAWVRAGVTVDTPWAVTAVLAQYDSERVLTWIRNLAIMAGEQL